MIKKLSVVLLLICKSILSFAQSNDYFNLKDVKTYRFDHLELSTPKAIDQFIQSPSDYNFIEALKINQTAKLNEIFTKTGVGEIIKELNLIDYHGEFNANTFDSCSGIEILHISINEEKLDALKYISKIKNLETLYIYILGKPENLSALKSLPILKELHIIGDFLPKDLVQIPDFIQNQTTMQTLGLSIDRITDLPANIIRFKTLSRLNLYDNLSVFTNKGIEDLSEEKLSILFNINSDNINAISISYFSNNGKLIDFEIEYLQNLYKGEIVPQQFGENENDKQETGNIPFAKEFVPDFGSSPEFNKPYPKISPNTEYFTINPSTNSLIYSNSGLKLSVAANSFVNEKGEDITVPIYLKLIQINSPSDILFAGLNFKNGDRQFCNQFLFNIQATCEKSSAKLKDGYQIKANLPVNSDSALTYFFDYESNTWQDLNFYNQVFAANFTPIDFYKIENSNQCNSYYQFDTSSFKQRFFGKHNIFLSDKENNSQLVFKSQTFYTDLDRTWNKDFNSNGNLKGLKIKKGKSYIKIQKVIPKIRNKERQYFKVLDKTEQEIFAELKAFKAINFNTIVNAENKKEFNETYIKNTKYFDVRIHYTKGKEYCEINIKTIDGFKRLQAFITDTDDKKLIKKQISKFAKAYKNYLHIRAKRELEFNALNKIRFSEFKAYSNERIKGLQKDNKISEIKIHQLGTFGYLLDKTPSFSTNIIAQYTDETGLPIDVKNLFLIDSRYNSVFKIQIGNISFDPNNVSCIVATDYSGNLYYANKSDISASNLSNNSLIYIKLKKVSPNLSNINLFNLLLKN
jgi:hypothetical protein